MIVIAIDTLRSDRLSCYGYERSTSPRIDELASAGALFLDVTAQSGWTRPSMVSMLTGRYVTAHRTDIGANEVSLASAFSGAGYRTVGVIANRTLTRKAGFASGFDSYSVFNAELPRSRSVEFDHLTGRVWEQLDAEPSGSRGQQPLFLYVHAFFPHAPYVRHVAFDDVLPVDDAPRPSPDGWRESVLRVRARSQREDGELRPIDLSRGRYDHEVRYTDLMLTRLLDGLAKRGLLEHAVVALVADHGEGLGDHAANLDPRKQASATPSDLFYMAHGAHLYEESIRTPFVLWGRGVPPGARFSDAVENVDLFPTLAELAGIAVPPGLHGHSLVGLLHGGPAPPRDAVFSYLDHKACVRELSSQLKLTLPGRAAQSEFHTVELFELSSDPYERHNLYGERPEDEQRLRGRLAAWIDAHPSQSDDALDDDERALLEALGYTSTELGDER